MVYEPKQRLMENATQFFCSRVSWMVKWIFGAASSNLIPLGGDKKKENCPHRWNCENPALIFVPRGNGLSHRDLLAHLTTDNRSGYLWTLASWRILDLKKPAFLCFPLSFIQWPASRSAGYFTPWKNEPGQDLLNQHPGPERFCTRSPAALVQSTERAFLTPDPGAVIFASHFRSHTAENRNSSIVKMSIPKARFMMINWTSLKLKITAALRKTLLSHGLGENICKTRIW